MVDGGPDQNPRFFATRYCYSRLFVQYDLDLLVVICHPGGHSAFNPVERGMSGLTKLLTGKCYSSNGNGSTKIENADYNVEQLSKLFSTCNWAGAKYCTSGIKHDYESRWQHYSYEDIMKFKSNIVTSPERFMEETRFDDYHCFVNKYKLVIVKCRTPESCPFKTCKDQRSRIRHVFADGLPFSPHWDADNNKFLSYEQRLNRDDIQNSGDQDLPSVQENRKERGCQKY